MNDLVKNYRKKLYKNYLIHHGVKGQKWGIKNGPPYPLDAKGQLRNVLSLNEELNKWDYAVIIDGKKITDLNKANWSHYKTTPVEDVLKNKAGICWDFVNYQHSVFKSLGYPDDSYMFVMQKSEDPNDIVTHTFSTVNIGDKLYWFESSWFKNQGVHEIYSYKDVIDELVKTYGKHDYDIYSYNPDGLDKGLTNGEFFKKVTKNLIYTTTK